MKKCIKCNAELDDNAEFCGQCGAAQSKKKTCSKCHSALEDGFQFCPHCGLKVKKITKAELNKAEKILHKSYIDGMGATLQHFIDNGLDIDDGEEPLLCKACRNEDMNAVETLLTAGADIDVYDYYDNYTPLLIACETDNNKLVKLLIEHGADCECTDRNGNSPLSLARDNGNRYIVGLLHKKGVDISQSDDDSGSGSSSGCYITSATCENYGKPDDCYELTAFRNFRDAWLRLQPDGENLIRQYYRTAPSIVAAINAEPNKDEIYRAIYEKYLLPCLSYIEKGENEKCKEHYTVMIHILEKSINTF